MYTSLTRTLTYTFLITAAFALVTLVLPSPASAAECNIYGASTGAPSGYGAAYNVFKTAEMMVSIDCNEDKSIKVTAGNNDPLTYIYKDGYYYNPSAKSWTKFSYSCDNMIADAWCVGRVNKTLTDVPTDAHNFLVSFTCQWSGNKWNCGCSNTSCSTAKWQIQGWKVAPPSGGGGGTMDPNAEGVIFSFDFEDEDLGSYTKSEMETDWKPSQQLSSNSTMKIVNDPAGGSRGKVMQAFYRANTVHNSNGSGFYWRKKIGSHNEMYFAYDVYFENDADFTKGGKLPGLGIPNYFSSAGDKPDGTDRWTGGLQWGKNGIINSYIYHANQPNRYGHNLYWKDGPDGQVYFQRGKWNRVEIYYKMNTPGKLDGRLTTWLNGQLALDTSRPMYRMPGGEHLTIGAIAMASGYGGGQDYAPSRDQHIYFDNITVSTNPITH